MDEQEFIEKYGATTTDGILRFTDDHSFLHHPSEVSYEDAYKIGGISEFVDKAKQDIESFWSNLADGICDKIGW